MNATFTRPATIYLFADKNGCFQDYKLSDEPSFDGYWDNLDLIRVHADGGTTVEDGEYLIVSYPHLGRSFKLRRANVVYNDDSSQLFYQGIVFDVYDSDGSLYFMMSKDQ